MLFFLLRDCFLLLSAISIIGFGSDDLIILALVSVLLKVVHVLFFSFVNFDFI